MTKLELMIWIINRELENISNTFDKINEEMVLAKTETESLEKLIDNLKAQLTQSTTLFQEQRVEYDK